MMKNPLFSFTNLLLINLCMLTTMLYSADFYYDDQVYYYDSNATFTSIPPIYINLEQEILEDELLDAEIEEAILEEEILEEQMFEQEIIDAEIAQAFYIFNPYRKNAIIVGAATDTTMELITLLNNKGYIVGLIDSEAKKLSHCKKARPQIHTKKITLASPTKMVKAFNELVDELKGVDLVILNMNAWPELASYTQNGLMPTGLSFSLADEKKTIDVNVQQFVVMANAAINCFLNQGSGQLVGVSSLDIHGGNPACPAYSASKAFASIYLQGLQRKMKQLHMPITITDIRREWAINVANGAIENYWTVSAKESAKMIVNAIVQKKSLLHHQAMVANCRSVQTSA